MLSEKYVYIGELLTFVSGLCLDILIIWFDSGMVVGKVCALFKMGMDPNSFRDRTQFHFFNFLKYGLIFYLFSNLFGGRSEFIEQ